MSKRHIWIKLCWCQLGGPTEIPFSPWANWKHRANTRQKDPTTEGKVCIWNVLLDKHAMPKVADWVQLPAGYLKWLGVEPQWHFSGTWSILAQRHMSGPGVIGCWTSQTMQNAAVCFEEGDQNRCCDLRAGGSCFKCVNPMWRSDCWREDAVMQHCGCQIYNSGTSGTQTPKTLDLPLVNFELHPSSLYPQAWSWHSNQVDSWRVMKSPPTQALRLGILSQTHKTITIHQCSCYTPTLGLAKFGL